MANSPEDMVTPRQTSACFICHRPDSYTHIAGEYPDHEARRINRRNAACQFVHAAIRKSAKGGESFHRKRKEIP
jgi:hypothetical protein